MTTAAELTAMPAADRQQYVGNTIYPRIAGLIGEQNGLAGKVTGMCLELPVDELVLLMSTEANLRAAIDQALAVLPTEMQPKLAPPPPQSPAAVSPDSVLTANPGSDRWADDDAMDTDDLPPVRDLFASVEKKREAKKAAAAPEGEAPPAPAFDVDFWTAQPAEETVKFVSQRLQEPQLRIVRAVVDLLGAATALDLLARTERIQADGGLMVEETGKPRTSGGIFLKLLKEATHLPEAEQKAAVERIKVEGKKVKPSQKAGYTRGGNCTPRSPAPESSPTGPPAAVLGDFMEAAQRAKGR